MPDTNTPSELAVLFARNRAERDDLSNGLEAAKQELRRLVLRGRSISMEVSEMSNLAGVSRDTAHRIIREAGAVSWKDKQGWTRDVLAAIPRDRGNIDQQMFRSLVEIELLSALGSKQDAVPPSLGDIFKRATISVRERGSTSFVPAIDEAGLAQLAEWPVEPFEIVQLGTGELARFQLQQQGIALAPVRETPLEVARDLLQYGGKKPTYLDRTGPECVMPDGRRVSWGLLNDLARKSG